MAQQKTEEYALQLYHQRLENLPIILSDLYSIVKADQSISSMIGPELEKYRVQRVDELVREIMNSEKQKLLIKALEKCEELSRMCQQKKQTGRGDKQHAQKKIQTLEKLLSFKDKQIVALQSQLSENKSKMNQLWVKKQQSREIQCQKCQENIEKYLQLQQKMKLYETLTQKLKSDGAEAVDSLKNSLASKEKQIASFRSNFQISQEKITKLQQQLLTKSNQTNSQVKRKEKIQFLKNHIKNLEDQLVAVSRSFHVMQQNILGVLKSEIQGFKQYQKAMKIQISGMMSKTKKQNLLLAEQLMVKVSENAVETARMQKKGENQLSNKINQINNRIDYFLENQLIA